MSNQLKRATVKALSEQYKNHPKYPLLHQKMLQHNHVEDWIVFQDMDKSRLIKLLKKLGYTIPMIFQWPRGEDIAAYKRTPPNRRRQRHIRAWDFNPDFVLAAHNEPTFFHFVEGGLKTLKAHLVRGHVDYRAGAEELLQELQNVLDSNTP